MLDYFLTKFDHATPEGVAPYAELSDYIVTDGPRGPVYWEDLQPSCYGARYFVLRSEFWSLAADFCVKEVAEAPTVDVRVQFIFEDDFARANEYFFFDTSFEFKTLDQWKMFVDDILSTLKQEVELWSQRVVIQNKDDDDQSDQMTESVENSEDEEGL